MPKSAQNPSRGMIKIESGPDYGLVKPANRKDYTVRMREFFDHHLMDKPAPAWLKEGVPHFKQREESEGTGKE